MIKQFAYMYVIFDVLLILISLFMGGFWLINTQVAFIASMLIIFASFYSFQKAVNTKSPQFKDEDFSEEIEDKEIIKKTRKIAKTSLLTFSPFRLLSYLFLVLAFLYLNRHNWLEIAPFLLGLSIVPIVSIVGGFWSNKR